MAEVGNQRVLPFEPAPALQSPRARRRLLALALFASARSSLACGPAIRTARRTAEEPPFERELEAAEKPPGTGCSAIAGALVPGLGQLCDGRTAEGVALMGLAAAELGTGIGVAIKHDVSYPGAAIPLLALSDLWLYQGFQANLIAQRAQRLLYVPQDSLGELALAPFNGNVLKQPEVWAGILGTVAAGIAVSALLDGWPWRPRDKPRLFGIDYAPLAGYPIAGAVGIGLFEHVSIAEETVFRGYFQSGFARRYGEDRGLVYGSLLFGLLHAPNALFLDSSQRLKYLTIGVPFLTLVGSYLGLSYRLTGYSLAPPVAIHFWYDLLISAAGFLADPQHNELSGRIAIPF